MHEVRESNLRVRGIGAICGGRLHADERLLAFDVSDKVSSVPKVPNLRFTPDDLPGYATRAFDFTRELLLASVP